MNHKYSSYVLVIFVMVLIAGFAISDLDTNDLDDMCNNNSAYLKRTNGAWGCNVVHFAEGHYQNYATPLTLTITSTGVYYNVTGYEAITARGISTSGESVTINKDGWYRLIGTMSFSGGNQGDYETALFVNENERHECSFQRTTSSTAIGDATLACIVQLNNSNRLTMRVKDMTAPAQSVSIYALNFNIVEVT